MPLDAGRFREILTPLHPAPISPVDAERIVELAQLTLDADGHENTEEIQVFFALARAVFDLAGLRDAPIPTFATDDEDHERMRELAGQLKTAEVRELAFGCAHLLSISDFELGPAEDAFMAGLRDALAITEDRAEALAAQLNAAITPPG